MGLEGMDFYDPDTMAKVQVLCQPANGHQLLCWNNLLLIGLATSPQLFFHLGKSMLSKAPRHSWKSMRIFPIPIPAPPNLGWPTTPVYLDCPTVNTQSPASWKTSRSQAKITNGWPPKCYVVRTKPSSSPAGLPPLYVLLPHLQACSPLPPLILPWRLIKLSLQSYRLWNAFFSLRGGFTPL